MEGALTFSQLVHLSTTRDFDDCLSAERAIVIIENQARKHWDAIVNSRGVVLPIAGNYRGGFAPRALEAIRAHFANSGLSMEIDGAHVHIQKQPDLKIVEQLVTLAKSKRRGDWPITPTFSYHPVDWHAAGEKLQEFDIDIRNCLIKN